jgi:hypothetical protein
LTLAAPARRDDDVSTTLIQYVISFEPENHPQGWITREWCITRGGLRTEKSWTAASLEEARSHVLTG